MTARKVRAKVARRTARERLPARIDYNLTRRPHATVHSRRTSIMWAVNALLREALELVTLRERLRWEVRKLNEVTPPGYYHGCEAFVRKIGGE